MATPFNLLKTGPNINASGEHILTKQHEGAIVLLFFNKKGGESMLKFKVHYSYLQGPDHHSQDYMTPDALPQRYNDSRVVEAASEEEVEKKFRESVLFSCTIDSIEKIKE